MTTPPRTQTGDLDTAEFEAAARRALDWTAAFLRDPERYPVLSRSRPGEIRKALPAKPPTSPEPFDAILDDFETIVVPGITHWNHPGFFAYFANSSPAPSIVGEMLTAAINPNGMLWKTSPAATELELVVLDWLRQMLGLPEGLFGVIQDTASASTLVALAAAREAVPGLESRRRGLVGQARLRLYASEQAHSSIERAGIVLGIGQEGCRAIPVDDRFAMRPEALEAAIREDRAAGLTPFAVVATVGTTSTTSVDPVARIADICEQERLWLHVDAAYGGAAAVLPEMRHHFAGWERADSIVFNPHKWLFVTMDLSVLFTRHRETLQKAFSIVPEYLRTPEESVAPNLMDYGVSLGRRFRALKLWFVLRAFGTSGIEARVREHIRLAQVFRGWLESDPLFEVNAPSPFSNVCFRIHFPGVDDAEADRRVEAVMEAVNASGEAYISHTKLRGRATLRLAVGNIRTEERHVRRAYDLIRAEAAARGGS
ncbi:MAG: pyridoxal-dependent decarboxylase [Actinomycetota bacterium]|nr:pyridoxal-dependent decarboxylase [Actinomycetota bacterium]